ncbi:eCIS core domain-containing protein [Sphaerospermopsis reniformis]|nr:DUF4157 domain-containing protein [Sphaerospermopsis reniformis]
MEGGMSDRTFARKKTATSTFYHSSLVSPTTPTLANPVRGFGLTTNNVMQTATEVSTQQQPEQSEQQAINEQPITHDISRISFRRPQAKLTVGEPGDKYEQEADMMAHRVMSIPATAIQREAISQEEELQTKPALQTASHGNLADGDSIESRLNSSKGGGSPLADNVRSFMKPRFGADFSQVRVHTDSTAVQMNRQLGAQAFTHGSDVYYGEGKAPGNNQLTAHELTHVVQQLSLSSGTYIQKSPVSALAKQGVKAAAKKAIQEFIENQIKSRLQQYMSKQFAKQFIKDADDILSIMDSSWWEIGLELIPVAGDIYGIASFTKKLDKLWERVKFLEKKVQLVTTAASKTLKKINLSAKLTGKGKDKLEAFTNKVNRLAEHLTEDDLAGAAKDILGEPVKIGGKQYDHLKEVNDALKGLGNQLDQLKNSIKNSEFEGDTLEEAKRLLSTVSRQKDEIQNVLIKVQGGI